MKKLLSALVVLMLVISSCTVAFATENSTLALEEATQNTEEATIETTPLAMVGATTADTTPTSAEATEPIIDYPEITSIKTTSGGLKISWESYDSAYRYRLFIKRDDNSGWKTITTTSNLSYTHTGLINNKEYIYTLRAVDENGAFSSAYNKEGWAFTYLQSPVLKSVSSDTNGLKITWDHVFGAVNYKVYKRVNNAWTALGYTTENTFTDTYVQSGNTYTYTVRCVTEDGKDFTSHHTSGKSGKYVATPYISKVSNTATGTKIYFNKVAGAQKYRVFYKVQNGWKGIATTTSNYVTHSPLNSNTTYTYTVRACNSNGAYISAYDKTGVENTFLSTPVLKSLSSNNDGLEIKWNEVVGAENYRVYVKTGSSWVGLSTTTKTSYIDKNVQSGKSYTYTVRCLTKDGSTYASYFDTKGITGTYIETPLITQVENLKDGVKVTWNKVDGVSKYKLFYKLSDGSGWKTIGTTTSDNFTHKPISDGDTFTYTVRGCNSKGSYISGYDKVGVTNTFIAPLSITSITNNNGKMILNWEDNEFAYGYRVYRKEFSGSWVEISNVTSSYYIDTNTPEAAVYTYTIRCIDENGNTISSYLDNNKYYYDGKVANGKITVNGTAFSFTNGYLTQGYVRINSKLYYYDKNGQLQKNGIVGTKSEGYYYADENGVCCESEEIRLAAEFMMTKATGSTPEERMKTGFNYLSMNFPYSRSFDHPKKASDIPKQAIDMFTQEKGNCFKYASCFACIAKVAGYRARVVVGTTPGFGIWTPHGWTEVYKDGEWKVSDPDFQMMYPSTPYYYYMTSGARIPIRVEAKYEVQIVDGKAIWK